MARHPEDLYGADGSVPNQQPLQASGAQAMNVRSTPEDMGAAIGQGVQKVGEAGEQVANMYGGLVLETASNQAELGYIKASGDLKAKYSQYEGLQAEAMRPQYEQDLETIHQQFRGNLPLGAQRAFDSNTSRSLGYQTGEYASYAAGQVKQANLSSNDALADASIAHAGNLPSVLDSQRFGELNGTITHAANAVADIKGWASLATGTDAETGKLTFGDDAQSQATKTQYEQYIAEKQSKLYLTAAKTIADNQGAAAAADWAKGHWNMMPDAAKVAMNQYIAPKMKNETISGNIVNQNSQLNSEWNEQFTANVPKDPTEISKPQKTSLDVIRSNEGVGYSKDNKGEVINGINSQAFPKEFAEAKNILDTQGQEAATKYADNFYQKNIIDKYNIGSLPSSVQSIVADGLVNHSHDFGQQLLTAAKAGASSQELIDMRRNEYQRLNNTGLPQYTSAFNGWNNRLDKFQTTDSVNQAFTSIYPNKADFLREKSDNFVQNSVNTYLDQYPDDYYGAQLQERRAKTEINRQISIEDGKLKADRDIVTNAISGAYTKNNPPATYQELASIPGIQNVLDRARSQQGAFSATIDTMISKASHRDLSQNSPNGYDAIQSVLDRSGNHDRQSQIEYLSKGLGSDNRGFSISWKDFQDAKPSIDLDDGAAKILADHMKTISTANGNVDGKGQDRAVGWYNQVMAAYKQNEALGDKKDRDFWEHIPDKYVPPTPSRMQQIASSVQNPKVAPTTATGANGEKYILQGDQWVKQ